MSAPIDYAALAETFEALNLPGAAHFREQADDESAAELADTAGACETLDALYALLDEIPAPAVSTKHSEMCWQRHARCLADLILKGTE